jgi:hypothetical protein
MKTIIILFVCLNSLFTLAQDKRETQIRQLEDMERLAILENDTTSLFKKYWAQHFKVNTPANFVADVKTIRRRIKDDKINYASFERFIEDITFDDNIAIVMGYEKLVPKGKSDNAGKVLTRRFTNIWKYSQNGGWKMIARQATIIKVE